MTRWYLFVCRLTRFDSMRSGIGIGVVIAANSFDRALDPVDGSAKARARELEVKPMLEYKEQHVDGQPWRSGRTRRDEVVAGIPYTRGRLAYCRRWLR